MKMVLAAMTFLVAGACSNDNVPVTQSNEASGSPAATGTAASVPGDQVMALGLTARQLEDAEIIDASGRELADVERLVTGPGGELAALIVEIEDSNPDQLVTLPLQGLEMVQNGDDRDLRTNMTREQLQALPAPATR